MKKVFSLLVLGIILLPNLVYAASGNVTVHYYNEKNNGGLQYRQGTFDYTKEHMGSIGYNVQGHDNMGSSTVLSSLQNDKILVIHTHGRRGCQLMKTNWFCALAPEGETITAVNSIGNGTASQMKIAIYYGCNTGIADSKYGDLPRKTVEKGAQAAVAWTIETDVNYVNEWNRLFFEKAKSYNIVEGFRHADYWLREIKGADAADDMQLNRNEKGKIYGYVY